MVPRLELRLETSLRLIETKGTQDVVSLIELQLLIVDAIRRKLNKLNNS